MKRLRLPVSMSFRSVLLILLWAFSLVPLLVCALITSFFLRDAYSRNTANNLELALSQIVMSIEDKQEGAYNICELLANDYRLQMIERERLSPIDRYRLLNEYLQPRLHSALYAAPDRMRLSLYLKNDNIPEVYQQSSDEYRFLEPESNPMMAGGGRYEIFSFNRLSGRDWLDDNGMLAGSSWRYVAQDEYYGNLSYLHAIYNLETMSVSGLIRVNIFKKDLFAAINSDMMPFATAIQVRGSDGKPIYDNAHSFPDDNEDAYYHLAAATDDGFFTIHAAIRYDDMMRDLRVVNRIFLTVVVMISLLLLGLGFALSKGVSANVSVILSGLRGYYDGDMNARIRLIGTQWEFFTIAQAFNGMMDSMQDMIYREYVLRLERLRIEQSMLQAQINPHFLYNMLSTIGNLSVVGESDKIREIVGMLAAFYRATLSRKQVVSLKEELHQIRQYVSIMAVKFQDRLRFKIYVPDELMESETLPFILQPFVENSIHHGWIADTLEVTIGIREEADDLLISVTDDGVGFTMADDMDAGYMEGDHYGIANVHQRLRLHYGEAYGVRISSYPGKGTEVLLRLPRKPIHSGAPEENV